MPQYEYKVVPAPTKGIKARGVKTPEGRFANSVETVLNAQGADGWEYLRAELLPSEERVGLTGSTTNWRNVLVFRRLTGADVAEAKPAPGQAGAVEALGSADTETTMPDGPEQGGPQQVETMEQTEQEAHSEKLIAVSGMFAAQDARAANSADRSEAVDQGAEPKA